MLSSDFWSEWDKEDGFITIDEGKVLYECAKQLPIGSTILEIGCYHGKSTIAILEGCKDAAVGSISATKLISVDYFAGQGMQIVDTTPDETAGGIAAVTNIVSRYRLSAWHTQLYAMKSEDWFKQHTELYCRIDLVFIDGCHQLVDQDIRDVLPYLKSGSVILCHDFWPIPSEFDWITKKILSSGLDFVRIDSTAIGKAVVR